MLSAQEAPITPIDAITILGTAATLWGLWLTYKQAKGAKAEAASATSAAEGASKAVASAVRAISERATIADVSSIVTSLRHLIDLLEAKRPEIVLHDIRHVRDRLNELRGRTSRGLDQVRVQGMVSDIYRVQEALENHLHEDGPPPRVSDVSKLLAGISARLIEMTGTLSFPEKHRE